MLHVSSDVLQVEPKRQARAAKGRRRGVVRSQEYWLTTGGVAVFGKRWWQKAARSCAGRTRVQKNKRDNLDLFILVGGVINVLQEAEGAAVLVRSTRERA